MIFLHDEGNDQTFAMAESYKVRFAEDTRLFMPNSLRPEPTPDTKLIFTGRKTPVSIFVDQMSNTDGEIIIAALVKMLGGAVHIASDEMFQAFGLTLQKWKTDTGGLWLKMEDQ